MDYEIACYEIWVKDRYDWHYEMRDEVGTEEDAIEYRNRYINKGFDCNVYRVERLVFPND